MKIKRLFLSFRDASRGIRAVFLSEQNFRIQLIVSAIVGFFLYFFPLSKGERIVMILLIFLVLVLELLNSAVERLADIFKPRLFHQVEIIKDIMAAVVLSASLSAIIIGIMVFWPYAVAFFFGAW